MPDVERIHGFVVALRRYEESRQLWSSGRKDLASTRQDRLELFAAMKALETTLSAMGFPDVPLAKLEGPLDESRCPAVPVEWLHAWRLLHAVRAVDYLQDLPAHHPTKPKLHPMPSGADFPVAVLQSEPDPAPVRDIPRWDAAAKELSFRGVVIKHYRTQKAENQTAILDAFEKANWPERLHYAKMECNAAIEDVLKGLKRSIKTGIRFGRQGLTITWEPIE